MQDSVSDVPIANVSGGVTSDGQTSVGGNLVGRDYICQNSKHQNSKETITIYIGQLTINWPASIPLPRKLSNLANEHTESLPSEGLNLLLQTLESIPKKGLIPAGLPQRIKDRKFRRERTYTREVEGESMTGAGIYPGDTVVFDTEKIPSNGDIVDAFVKGEGRTLKKLFYDEEPEYIRLEPANPDFSVKRVHYKDVAIQGAAVAVIPGPAMSYPSES